MADEYGCIIPYHNIYFKCLIRVTFYLISDEPVLRSDSCQLNM